MTDRLQTTRRRLLIGSAGLSLSGMASAGDNQKHLLLFDAFPSLGRALPYEPLGRRSRVELLAGFGARIGLSSLWVKRDDLSAEPYGGNKVRKLSFVLADAKHRGCHRVVTFGGYGSNHALATAVHARRLGLDVELNLLPEPNTEHVRHNLLAAVSFGAKLRLSSVASIDRIVRQTQQTPLLNPDTYVIPPGGTCTLGNIGYVDAAFELRDQVERGELPEPDALWVAAGTIGTAAGLAVGLAAAGMRTRVHAVRTSSLRYVSKRALAQQIAVTTSHLRGLSPRFPQVDFDPSRHLIEHRYVGRGYALPTTSGQRAIQNARETSSLTLDTTYTAKVMAGLSDQSRTMKGQVVLFWHTYDGRPLDIRGLGRDDVPPGFRTLFPAAGGNP